MKEIICALILSCIVFSTAASAMAKEVIESDKKESVRDWVILFDGESTEHWRGYNSAHFPSDVWKIEGDELVFRPSENAGTSDIITKKKYSDFELELEWWISGGGNSGIFHGVVEQPGVAIYWSGIELQIIDAEGYEGLSETQKAGALYDMKPAVPQNVKPQGEWNSVRIISNGPHVEYWQNGEKVVEYERWSKEWYTMVRNSKFECHPSFGNAPSGHIGLQDHGNLVKFRNIRIREL
jgi:hypothetical protein